MKLSLCISSKDQNQRKRWLRTVTQENTLTNSVVCEMIPCNYETVVIRGNVRPRNPPSVSDHLPSNVLPSNNQKQEQKLKRLLLYVCAK